MTNQDYLQWEPMLKKIAYKYKNNKFGLEIDDLMQIATLGFINGFKTYKKDYNTSELNYYYTCAEREILKEFQTNSHASRVQATPPPCPLCSQKVQNCLPNAYYTWRGSFYCIGISQKKI